MVVINTRTKSNLERKEFILAYSLRSIVQGTQSRSPECQELKQRPWRSAAYWIAHLAVLYKPGPPTQGGTAHSSLGPPTSIMNQETVPTDLPPGLPNGGTVSVKVPSSQIILVYVRLTKTGVSWMSLEGPCD